MEHDFIYNANAVRGYIINEFSNLEKIIESFIKEYFLGVDNKKGDDFNLIITDRMTFEAKRTSLRSIFEKIESKKGFVKTKNNSYPNSKIFEEIRLLNDQRIYFAHYIMAMPFSDEDDSVINLAETRDNVRIIPYSKKDIDDVAVRIGKSIDEIIRIVKSYRDVGMF